MVATQRTLLDGDTGQKFDSLDMLAGAAAAGSIQTVLTFAADTVLNNGAPGPVTLTSSGTFEPPQGTFLAHVELDVIFQCTNATGINTSAVLLVEAAWGAFANGLQGARELRQTVWLENVGEPYHYEVPILLSTLVGVAPVAAAPLLVRLTATTLEATQVINVVGPALGANSASRVRLQDVILGTAQTLA